MNPSESKPTNPPPVDAAPPRQAGPAPTPTESRLDQRLWWIKLLIQPMAVIAAGLIVLATLGIAQRFGYLTSVPSRDSAHAEAKPAQSAAAVQYICPMMCTPPSSAPGRCPVCAMELVATTSGGDSGGSTTVEFTPAARRVANIETVEVQVARATRTVSAIGELTYDEGGLRTLAAYVDGRIERNYADYTGMVVRKGDHLALLYSPRLYSSQVELLLAKRATLATSSTRILSTDNSNRELYDSARQRLIELGMTVEQIHQLEQAGKANSRLQLCAPISGTVIEKLANEGQYVKEGQVIYRLADLSSVWLMLELFPEDAAAVHFGQQVTAEVQSLPGKQFVGRVAFVNPTVTPATRTVGVRVVIPNPDGQLRIGDYAKATVAIAVSRTGQPRRRIYDPELANKWVGPRHPHIQADAPGQCPLCGSDLIPAAQFGFTTEPVEDERVLTVPRNAVLAAGEHSVLYVETKPGLFEIRRVTLGPVHGDTVAILDGVRAGEQVATNGNFLIDSQMQLAGNPSLIDPTKLDSQTAPAAAEAISPKALAALAKLPPDERRIAEQQRICPVTKMPLGSMGIPVKVDVKGTPVFLCCEGCRESLQQDPDKYLAVLAAAAEARTASDRPAVSSPPIGAVQQLDNSGPPSMDIPAIGTVQPIPDVPDGDAHIHGPIANSGMEVQR